MVKNSNGMALIMVLMFTAVFTVLGLALLELSLADMRISRNVGLYDRLYYCAEAGIEEAVARLPRQYGEFCGFEGVFERTEAPGFVVEVIDDGEGKLIQSVGMSGGKSRQLTARVEISALGGYVIYAGGEARLARVAAGGNVGGEKVVFGGGESVVEGSLFACCVEQDGGSYVVAGRVCPREAAECGA
jgi:hypothetical protein